MSGGPFGILSGLTSPQGGGGILDGFHQFVQDNGAALIAGGGGLLAGDGWGGASQSFLQGMQQDQRTRLIKQKEAEEEHKKQALAQAATKLGIDPILAQASPELIGAVAAKRYAPPKEYGVEETYLRRLQQSDPARFSQIMESKFNPQRPAPSGYRYKTDGALEPIPGGPAMAAEAQTKALPGELAAKFGLANEYFKRYDGIEADLKSEDPSVIGAWDNTRAQAGMGKGGAIYRDIKLGSEAMTRLLTGAGMSENEAKNEVAQYLPALRDDAKTVLDKQKRLRSALRSMQRQALRGRMPDETLDNEYPEFPLEAYPAEKDARAPGNIGVNRATAGAAKQAVQAGSYNYVPGQGLVPTR